jgi:sugar phosphate isomerase/epimerase
MKKASRREFFRLGLRGAAALATVPSFGGAAPRVLEFAMPAPSSVIAGLQIGCMTWSFRNLPLADALKNIASIGFSSAELWNGHLDPLKSPDSELAAWKERFTNAGVKITSYFVDVPGNASDEQITRCFEAGRTLDVTALSGNFNTDLLPRLDQACQKYKISVGLHNEVYNPPDPHEVGSAAGYVEAFRNTSDWIGATLDVGHLYSDGDDPVQFIRGHFSRIVSVHLKDEGRDAKTTDYPFGKGPTPLVPILHTLQSLQFKHGVNIEWGVKNVDPARGVADALAYIRNALA